MQTRDSEVASLKSQIDTLTRMGPDRPFDLFAPVRIEIVSRSGGQDYDGIPGDDGVTLYVRPRDADGDVVKVPGRISVQLLDQADIERPTVVGVYQFTDPETLRNVWYGKLGSDHYTLKCPFPTGSLPSRSLHARVEFTEWLTGKTLTASAEFAIRPPADGT